MGPKTGRKNNTYLTSVQYLFIEKLNNLKSFNYTLCNNQFFSDLKTFEILFYEYIFLNNTF